MCGRFAQSQTREEYLAYLAEEAERDIAYDPEPIGRYNVAPGTKVLLLSERDEQLHLDPVHWGYEPGWWDKPPLINARVETAANSRMFKPLWQHGRAICFADGWFEWKREGDKKQPYFIHRKDGQPIFMAAIGSVPRGHWLHSAMRYLIRLFYSIFFSKIRVIIDNLITYKVNSFTLFTLYLLRYLNNFTKYSLANHFFH